MKVDLHVFVEIALLRTNYIAMKQIIILKSLKKTHGPEGKYKNFVSVVSTHEITKVI